MSGRGTIELIGGRTLYLRSLQQHDVYAGLLEGCPTRERNEHIVRYIVEQEQTRGTPYLVPPHQEPVPYTGRYPFGEPASLPHIACVGRFHSLEPARDPSKDYSTLAIIWFQNDYAFPIEPEALEKIRAVDWAGLAFDFDH